MKLLTIGLLSLTLSLNAFSAETNICVITSDIDAERTDLLIETNSSGDLDSVRLYKTIGTKVVSDETHPVEKVLAEGVVAAQREGRDVVYLKAKDFEVKKGATIVVDYLYNGLKSIRRQHNLRLTRVGNNYVLSTMEGVKVNRIKFLGNRAPIIKKIIGIREVVPSFQ